MNNLDNNIRMFLALLLLMASSAHSKDFLVHGPFKLKGVDHVSIQFMQNDDESISFLSKYGKESKVIDIYSAGNGAPKIETVFFVSLTRVNNVVVLVSWDESNINAIHYKVSVYTYTPKGVIAANKIVSSDEKLEGYDGYNGNGATYGLLNSRDIKRYLKSEYDK